MLMLRSVVMEEEMDKLNDNDLASAGREEDKQVEEVREFNLEGGKDPKLWSIGDSVNESKPGNSFEGAGELCLLFPAE